MLISKVENRDCLEAMREFPDRYFDLAIVDPPYGISQPAFRKNAQSKLAKQTDYDHTVYNQGVPDKEYFTELFRVSRNQVVWGGNYYNQHLAPGNKWVFWDKHTEKTQWGDGELAWTSFPGAVVKFAYTWNGMLQGNMKNKELRIHPTQKPVALYAWLLNMFAAPGHKILDTHLGSGSSRIAAYKLGFDFWGYEVHEPYFKDQEKRFKAAVAMPLFDQLF